MDKEKNYQAQALDSSSWQIYGIYGASKYTRAALNNVWPVSVSDSDATKIPSENASGEKKKVVGECFVKVGVRVK
jgi:hypothetical protein